MFSSLFSFSLLQSHHYRDEEMTLQKSSDLTKVTLLSSEASHWIQGCLGKLITILQITI